MSIAKKALVGAIWASGANYISQGVGLYSTALLGRLILIYQFGVFDTANSLVQFIFILSAFSFNITIAQSHEERPHLYSTAFVLNIGLSIASLLLTGVAVFGYSYFRTLTVTEVTVIFSLLIANVLNLFGQHFDAILQRNLEFKKISMISFVMNLINPLAAVSLALLGAGVWSLVAGQLAAAVVFLAGGWWFAGWRVSLAFSRETARWFLVQGSKFLGSRSLEVVYAELGSIVIKSMNSYEQVGIYGRASKIAQYPARIVSPAIINVALPVYAKMKVEMPRLSDAFGLVNFFLIRILLPFGLIFLLAPETFMTGLLGESWAPSAPVLRILAVFAVLFPIVENIRVLFYSLGRPEEVAKVRLLQIVVYIPLLVVLVKVMGITGAAVALVASIVVTYGFFLIRLRSVLDYPAIRTIGIPVLVAFVTFGVYSVLPLPVTSSRILSLLFSSVVIFVIFAICEALLEGRLILHHVRFLKSTLTQPTSEELEARTHEK
jgi:O-antigen/teichoic acid export membrane protein